MRAPRRSCLTSQRSLWFQVLSFKFRLSSNEGRDTRYQRRLERRPFRASQGRKSDRHGLDFLSTDYEVIVIAQHRRRTPGYAEEKLALVHRPGRPRSPATEPRAQGDEQSCERRNFIAASSLPSLSGGIILAVPRLASRATRPLSRPHEFEERAGPGCPYLGGRRNGDRDRRALENGKRQGDLLTVENGKPRTTVAGRPVRQRG